MIVRVHVVVEPDPDPEAPSMHPPIFYEGAEAVVENVDADPERRVLAAAEVLDRHLEAAGVRSREQIDAVLDVLRRGS